MRTLMMTLELSHGTPYVPRWEHLLENPALSKEQGLLALPRLSYAPSPYRWPSNNNMKGDPTTINSTEAIYEGQVMAIHPLFPLACSVTTGTHQTSARNSQHMLPPYALKQ